MTSHSAFRLNESVEHKRVTRDLGALFLWDSAFTQPSGPLFLFPFGYRVAVLPTGSDRAAPAVSVSGSVSARSVPLREDSLRAVIRFVDMAGRAGGVDPCRCRNWVSDSGFKS